MHNRRLREPQSFERLRLAYRAEWQALSCGHDRVEWLKRRWLELPIWDIDHWDDLDDDDREELATWLQEQIEERARILGCSVVMAAIVQELCRCWVDNTPPQSPHARRVLKAYG